ncbi:hypothetical protein [Taklimakanibacter deserti]|uniref:hypothetical protein n=1 Tax=Taklimakanibacter deserti TaxID=2267839 RepID=UPI003F686234
MRYRASHGCVRLDPENAAILFALVEEVGMANTAVVVKGRADETAREVRRQPQYREAQPAGPIFGSDLK